jgi:membrane-bound serine protease (ClpP class)
MLACLLAAPAADAQTPSVLLTRVDGTITPVVADHLEDGLRVAERERHAACVIEMDTPGGLLQSTREIVQEFLASDVPVVVYVAPSGARAASAGA